MNLNRTLTFWMALSVTGLAVALAAASAWGRAYGLHQQIPIAGISVAVVVAVHMAPAFLRGMPKLVLWPFWTLCLAGALYMHASFMTSASSDAAAARLASSPSAAARAEQRAAIEQALSSIKARPAGQIARQLSWTTDTARVAALQIELQEAQRADALRAQLVMLAAGTAAAADTATVDLVSQRLAGLLGVTAEAVGLAYSVSMALLLELFGMMLWFVWSVSRTGAVDSAVADTQVVQPHAAQVMQQLVQANVPAAVQHQMHPIMQADVHEPVQLVSDDLSRLRSAVQRGECQPTLTGIRTFMRCGQGRASELRRALNVQ